MTPHSPLSPRHNRDIPDDAASAKLLDALRRSGSSEELEGEALAVRHFRASRAGRSQTHWRQRSLALAVSSVLGATCAGGVAAAYATALPSPVQHAVHTVLGPIGVPDSHPSVAIGAGSGQRSGGTAGPSSLSNPTGTAGGDSSGRTAGQQVQDGPSLATRNGIAGNEDSNANTAPALPPPNLTVRASAQVVQAASTGLELFGTLSEARNLSAGSRLIGAYAESAAQTGWVLVGSAEANADGSVTIPLKPIDVTTNFELQGPLGSRSQPVTVAVVDPVTLTQERPTSGQPTPVLIAAVSAAAPGDTVVLQQREQDQWVSVQTAKLGTDRRADFFPTNLSGTFRAVLEMTSEHLQSISAPIEVTSTGTPPATSPTPT
jgi:hypothetical protein